MHVQLITGQGCPHVDATRTNLRRALHAMGLRPEWTEWDRDDPEAPDHVRLYGSPTILVEGRDLAGEAPHAMADGCRVYRTRDGVRGAPSVELIVAALQRAAAPSPPDPEGGK